MVPVQHDLASPVLCNAKVRLVDRVGPGVALAAHHEHENENDEDGQQDNDR